MLYLSCQEILFFNHVQTEKRKASQRFPSPVGESYFSIIQFTTPHRLNCMFPSPIGESYFSIPSPTPACSSGLPRHFAWERDFHGILSIYSCSISAKALIYGLRRKTSFFPVFCRYIIPSEQFFHDNVYTSIYVEIHHI